MKKILYTFLLVCPLLFISSCEEEEEPLVNLPFLCQDNTNSIPDLGLFIPNVFTPNGDGINDYWRPHISSQITAYNLFIYNTNGVEVYSSTSPSDYWDGECNNEPCEDGQYNYSISLNGQNSSGGVSLVRDIFANEVFDHFPAGKQLCYFGDNIDQNYGFIYQTGENLAAWSGGNFSGAYPSLTSNEPTIADIYVINSSGEALSGVNVRTTVDVNSVYIVYREGITDSNGKVSFSFENVAILDVIADISELHGEEEITLEFGQVTSLTITVE